VSPTDRLTIETPEQIALELPLAGIGSRFLALAIDSLLQLVAVLGVFIVVALSEISLAGLGPALGSMLPAAIVFFFFCLYWGYFSFFESIWKGQTPGKRYAGIRVIKQTGRPISTVEAVTRNLLRAVDGLAFYAVGLICMMCNRQNRRIGDYVAGTVVVHERTIESVSPSWESGSQWPQDTTLSSKVSPDELILIETYLNRRYEIDPRVRLEASRKIVAMVQKKTGIEKPPDEPNDDFLEAVAKKVRDTAKLG
jgi:uncharacterized RDD family membrane protein YckC